MSGRGNVMSVLAKAGSTVGFSFGVRASTEMEIRCVKGMCRLKLISSENNAELNQQIFHMRKVWKLHAKYA